MTEGPIARPDLNLLTVFDAVMAEGSLTKAGARLGITQSAVSHALARLRDLTNDPLFERTGRGVRPTPRAHQMAEDVRAALDLLRSTLATTQAQFNSAEAVRTFHLDIPAGIDSIVVPHLATRVADAPGLSFRISGGRARSIRTQLRYGESWIALDYEGMEESGYRSELVLEDEFVVISRKDHPELRDGLTLDLYQSIPQVALVWAREDGSTPLTQRLERLGMRRLVKFAVPTIATLPAVVQDHDLVATLPRRLARSFAATYRIDIHPFPDHVPGMPVFMVWHESFEADPGHAWLRQVMRDICQSV